MQNTSNAAVEYAAQGWALVPLTRDKRPAREGWQNRDQCVTSIEEAATLKGNIGLAHAYSGTCCIDVDDFEAAELWLRGKGIELAELMAQPDAVRIESGRPGRGKLLYRLPAGGPLRTRKPVPGLELRCASSRGTTVQDVLPPSIHPITGKPYEWRGAGTWRKLPTLPAAVHAAWTAPEERTVSEEDNAAAGPVGLSDAAIMFLLDARDPDCGYDEWLRIGMALHHESQGEERGLDLWDAWSSRGEKYVDRADLEKHYTSFGYGTGPSVTLRSLIRGATAASPEEFEDLTKAIEEDAVEAAAEAAEEEADRLLSLSEVAGREPPGWLIKGILPKAGLAVLFGEPGSGKSFVAFDMAGCLARGVAWNGHRVPSAGRVCYVAAEGAGGMTLRAQAYAAQNPDIADAPIGFRLVPVDMLSKGYRTLANLIEKAGGADLIVIDTLAQSMPGGNENASEDMGKVIHNCGRLHRATGALVLLVHHSGKDVTRGARGWSGLRGAADAELEVSRDGDARSIRVGKQKDGADGSELPFRLVAVDLGRDADGDMLSSCVVEYLDPASIRRAREPAGAKQKLTLRVIRECADLLSGDVPVDTVVEQVARQSTDEDPRDARKAARRAIDALAAAGFIEVLDGQIRLL